MATTMQYNAVLFNLDGTLIDSAPDLNQTLHDLLAEHHRSIYLAERLHHVHYGARKLPILDFANILAKPMEDL